MLAHLFWETTCGNELECLHLSKVCWIAQHVNIHQFGHIPMPVCSVLVFESISERSALLSYDIPFFRSCLGLPNVPDELPTETSKFAT